ncbi:unnamed protein product [Didymodactylos carnosus]|uniref:Laminin G domain-containing protein n=1 Tax=Didymodactylos carnosus TaxID=1234261 RepID=A0A813WWB8_9BILA|nr:unnamed protein product [Didymodactylos carnosus]CAF1205437.1 unnamed protein product [Didymodactylos carnosus]CAF3654465.1 unnamed protein product [Didymodactylos carnosus]CAF4014905.1 unnamed protein product [Didymodactylos carnosus]
MLTILFFVWLTLQRIDIVQLLHFQNSSTFVIYPHLQLCTNGSFSFEFRTINRDGLLFYTDDSNINGNYISIEIINGKLLVEQRLISQQPSQLYIGENLNDNKWYKIVYKRKKSEIEILLYSVALRNMESQILTINENLLFGNETTNSDVYLGGYPPLLKSFSQKSFMLFDGYIRNLRYGNCGCSESIQRPFYSTTSDSEYCEIHPTICDKHCECLSVDEKPHYQCDCSNKTCMSTGKYSLYSLY